MTSLKIVDATAKVMTDKGYVLLRMNRYAHTGRGKTIHSCVQLEYFGNLVYERSLRARDGGQCIITLDGYVIPMDIISGLPYIQMEPNSPSDVGTLPEVVLTSPGVWDPHVLDNIISDVDGWKDLLPDFAQNLTVNSDSPFDEVGEYKHKSIPTERRLLTLEDNDDAPTEEVYLTQLVESTSHFDAHSTLQQACNLNQRLVCYEGDHGLNYDDDHIEVRTPPQMKEKPPDYDKLRPYFLNAPIEKARQTMKNTTQHARNALSGRHLYKTMKSPFPAYNVWRRNEPVASDTIYAGTPAIDSGGQTMAQFYCGRKSLVIDIYGMSNDNQFVNTLLGAIRERGAMDKLITDNANVEQSTRVQDILRMLLIKNWASEAGYQHQNYAERRWGTFKHNVQWCANWRNIPGEEWLLLSQWIADVMNMTAERSLGWRTPLEALTGQIPDISIMLLFLYGDIVYVDRLPDRTYRGQIGSKKQARIRGRFVGFAWNTGHALTFKILTDDTRKVIHRSRLTLANTPENSIGNVNAMGEIGGKPHITFKRDHDGNVALPAIGAGIDPFTLEHIPDNPVSLPHTTDQGGAEDNDLEDSPFSQEEVSDQIPVAETVTEGGDNDDEYDEYDDIPLLHPRSHTRYESDSDSDSDDEGDDYSPMPEIPLRSRGETEGDHDEEDLAPHQHSRKPGDQFDPLRGGNLKAGNPVEDFKGEIDPDTLVDRTFLMPPEAGGTRARAKIVERVNDHLEGRKEHPGYIKFKCLANNEREDIAAYNDIIDFIEQDQTWGGVWKFRKILGHKKCTTKERKEFHCTWKVLVEWESGEITWQPLHNKDKWGVYDTDPVTVAIYARENNLLKTPGWKLPLIKKCAKTQQRMIRMAHQAKLHSYRTKPVYMYGVQVPRNYEQAIQMDKENGNTLWQDAVDKELAQIDEYETFEDKGTDFKPGADWKKITVHLVFAVKHGGRRKARLVAGGHLTDTPVDSVYSSVAPLRGIRIIAFLAELNDLELWGTDIGNAYLESYTKEKVYIRAGHEFGDRCGHILLARRALYGLKSSGLRWSERFYGALIDAGFTLSKAENDIWMRDCGDHYEYIAVYVDDLLIASKKPQDIITMLEATYKFKLKGSGPAQHHLGCNYRRGQDGTLCMEPKGYIMKMMAEYERAFGQKPREYKSPLEKGDHPELDTSELLDMDQTKLYQSMIGALQWVIQLGRFDVATAVMTLSRFRAAPRQGHLDRVKRAYGYMSKMREGAIRMRTGIPDSSPYPDKVYDWEHSCYRGAKEQVPDDAPRPLGNPVQASSYAGANLYHDLISGRSVTGLLHFLNQTPIDWYTKLQSTVETATYGSEFIAARTCAEQIIDLRITLRYLGVPLAGHSMMFGDNESVVNSSSMPHSKLHKRHNALAYHKTRESIAAKILRFYFVRSQENPADILSKHWDYASVWNQLRPILFWHADTADIAHLSGPRKDAEEAPTQI